MKWVLTILHVTNAKFLPGINFCKKIPINREPKNLFLAFNTQELLYLNISELWNFLSAAFFFRNLHRWNPTERDISIYSFWSQTTTPRKLFDLCICISVFKKKRNFSWYRSQLHRSHSQYFIVEDRQIIFPIYNNFLKIP